MGQNEEEEKPPPVVTAAEVSLKRREKIIYPASLLEKFKIAMLSSLACFLEGEEWYKA